MFRKKKQGTPPHQARDIALSKGHFINIVPHHDWSTMFMILNIMVPNVDEYPEGTNHSAAFDIGCYGIKSKLMPEKTYPKIFGFIQYLTQLVEVIHDMSGALE